MELYFPQKTSTSFKPFDSSPFNPLRIKFDTTKPPEISCEKLKISDDFEFPVQNNHPFPASTLPGLAVPDFMNIFNFAPSPFFGADPLLNYAINTAAASFTMAPPMPHSFSSPVNHIAHLPLPVMPSSNLLPPLPFCGFPANNFNAFQ